MDDKILIELFIPCIDMTLDLYVPINKRIGNIITLIDKALLEIDEKYKLPNSLILYNRYTAVKYMPNDLVGKTDIRNGASLILI